VVSDHRFCAVKNEKLAQNASFYGRIILEIVRFARKKPFRLRVFRP